MTVFLGATLVLFAAVAFVTGAMAARARRDTRAVLMTVATVATVLGIANAAVLGLLIGISQLQA